MKKNNINRRIGFLQDDKGDFSMIRLLSLLTLAFAFLLISYQVVTDKINMQLIIILIVAAFAPKVFQKYYERLPGLGGFSSSTPLNPQNYGNGIYCRTCHQCPIISQWFYAQGFHQQHQGAEESNTGTITSNQEQPEGH